MQFAGGIGVIYEPEFEDALCGGGEVSIYSNLTEAQKLPLTLVEIYGRVRHPEMFVTEIYEKKHGKPSAHTL